MSKENPSAVDAANPSEQADAQTLEDRGSSRSLRPRSKAFRDFIAVKWGLGDSTLPPRAAVAEFTPARRAAVAAAFPGERLVIPAGAYKVRSNDTDYRFRAHTAFAHLTGLGAEEEPDAVLVIDAVDSEPRSTLFFSPRAGFDTEEFFSDARYGEFWVGARPSLDDMAARISIPCRHIDELGDALAKDVGPGGVTLRIVPGADAATTAVVESIRAANQASGQLQSHLSADEKLGELVSEIRLVKDAHEIDQMREAIAITANGFEDVVRSLPRAISHRRGERVIEGAFEARAREEGNGIGYDTIAAAGEHACTLHWIRNDGVVREGEMLLLDAGAEADSLYTADITRTLPINGKFTDVQRKIYLAVLEAADASFAVAKPGTTFRDLHGAAMKVIARKVAEWGLLPDGVDAEASLGEEGQWHRRWMVHGTSHHLGIDVHDCAQARQDLYLDGILEPGMVFTIEPGLYFHANDLSVPEEFRGIGVRIEDDVLVTADGCENLSAALPRTPDEIETWMARLMA